MRCKWFVACLVIGSFCMSKLSWALFEKVKGIEKTTVSKIVTSKVNPDVHYCAADNIVFKKENGGSLWKKIFVSQEGPVSDICLDPHRADILYIATPSSLYVLSSKKSKKIYTVFPETFALSVLKHRGTVYLGTTEGLFFADENAMRWKRNDCIPFDTSIYSLAGHADDIFASSNKGVYRIAEGAQCKHIFKDQEQDDGEDETARFHTVVYHDVFDEETLYYGTEEGLYSSYDDGASWDKPMPSATGTRQIYSIAQTPLEEDTLYLATDAGILRLKIKEKKSASLFEGLPTKKVNYLEFTEDGTLYAATEKGVFSSRQFGPISFDNTYEKMIVCEPTIAEIQEAALYYNHLHPDTIRKWRRSLQYRGLFPTIHLDYDKTVNYDSGSDIYYVGPKDWAVSFQWDLADLVWDTYEDDIDTRSRLMTQLRINVLDDINTLYFERLRIKQKLENAAGANEEEFFDETLRLKEFTAALDGYTGGYYSRRLRQLEKRRR